jgi:hypothetical protein
MTVARERDWGHLRRGRCHARPRNPDLGVDRRRSDDPAMPLPIGDRHRSDFRLETLTDVLADWSAPCSKMPGPELSRMWPAPSYSDGWRRVLRNLWPSGGSGSDFTSAACAIERSRRHAV